MARSEIIVGLDIGTTKVCTVVGEAGAGTAFRWRPSSGMENLGGAIARGCSVDGSVVVGDSFANNTTIATRWDPKNGLRTLGALGGIGSQAQAVSADGSVVVGDAGLPFVIIGGFSTSEFTAFRWSAGKMSQVSRV